MNRRKERFVETFVTVMFPVALLVACTTNGNGNPSSDVGQFSPTVSSDYNLGLTTQTPDHFTNALVAYNDSHAEDLSWAVGKSDENQYVIVSPSLHLAIYKPGSGDKESNDSIQMVNLKESHAIELPEKSMFHFKPNDYNTSVEDLGYLKEHAQFLLNNPQFTLTVSGHTDHTGPRDYNQKLSEQRAQFIADLLVTYGAPQSQLIVDGYGETVPLANASNLEQNRRVELQYSQPIMLSTM